MILAVPHPSPNDAFSRENVIFEEKWQNIEVTVQCISIGRKTFKIRKLHYEGLHYPKYFYIIQCYLRQMCSEKLRFIAY